MFATERRESRKIVTKLRKKCKTSVILKKYPQGEAMIFEKFRIFAARSPYAGFCNISLKDYLKVFIITGLLDILTGLIHILQINI